MTQIGSIKVNPRIYVDVIKKRLVLFIARPEPDHMYDWSLSSHLSTLSREPI